MLTADLRGKRPFPIDKDRQNRCMKLLNSCGMTVTELAFHLGVSKVLVSNTISGRQLSVTNETRIAQFFGVPREALFPLRTAEQIAAMREAELTEKAIKEQKKAERMRLNALSKGAA